MIPKPTIHSGLAIIVLALMSLSMNAFSGDVPNNKPIIDVNDRPAEAAAPVVIKTEEKNLSQRIQNDLRSDPLYKTAKINIDVYHGLVIVHGSAPSANMIAVLDDKLRRTPGVDIAYNYMQSPDLPEGQNAISVSYNNFSRLDKLGSANSAFALIGRVRDRLEADNVLSTYDFDIDAYKGLIIMNGTVNDPALAQRAREIAAHTDGVKGILSYIGVTGDEPAVAGSAPIYARELPEEMISAGTQPACEACGVR